MSSSRAKLAHVDVPRNPMTGEEEDTGVGFPGPAHHIAERDVPMKVAMAALALLAVIGGAVQIRGVDDAVTSFLAPIFADSHLTRFEPSNGSAWVGLVSGAAIAVCGIAIAYRIWIARPGTATTLCERLAPVHRFLVNKSYFDELIDFAAVRPALWVGRVADSVLERMVVGGAITGGTEGIVRASSAAVRRWQNGFVRYYAAAMVLGMFGIVLYFLLSSS